MLVANSNTVNAESLRRQLASWSMRADVATSGADALSMVAAGSDAKDPYRIVVVDGNLADMPGDEFGRRVSRDAGADRPALVMLTPMGMRGDAARMGSAGYDAYVSKPLQQSVLMDALATAWASVRDNLRSPLITRRSLLETRSAQRLRRANFAHAHILVVEDNPINQRMAARLLEKLGCTVDTAAHGLEGLERVTSGAAPYDLILMDCHMPVLNGFEATRHIREHEAAAGDGARVPICAVTAYVGPTDRRDCMDSGMDDYISKPIRTEKLVSVLERWIHGTEQPSDREVA